MAAGTNQDNRMFGTSEWYVAGKRAVDVGLAVALLIPALPLMLLAMAMVKLSSRGPAIYTQMRVGLGGRPFVIYKIRTMRKDCEKNTGPRWAERRDPRITVIGKFLRATHLDELPQLFNVLRGDMTLVGPRPERPEFVSQLELIIPSYRTRLDIRPGVTGLAQILLPPDVDVNSVRSKLTYDLFYLKQFCPWLDLKIIACTGLKVLGVPRRISRAALGVPMHEEIEAYYEAMIAESPSEEFAAQPVPARSADRPEMQPAF